MFLVLTFWGSPHGVPIFVVDVGQYIIPPHTVAVESGAQLESSACTNGALHKPNK